MAEPPAASSSGAVNLNAGTLAFNRSDAITQAAALSGAGGLRQDGTGTLTISGASSFSGGVTVNAGVVRITNATGAGSGGSVTINPNGTVAVTATLANPIALNGGTLGAAGFGTGNTANANVTDGDVTAQTGTTSTIRLGDPQNTTAASDVKFGGTSALHGSGNINVVSDQAGADGGAGLRLQGTGASDYTGTVTVNAHVKFELQTGQAGPFSPIGTGKVVMIAGTYDAASTNGTYSEFQVRNTIGGATTVGNDIEVTGTGLADLNFPANVANNVIIMGNLKVGAGQVLGVNKNSGTYQFAGATLNGTPTLSPNTPNFGANGAANLILGPIGQSTPGSGIIVNAGAASSVTFNGNNTYTGTTVVNAGTLLVKGRTTAVALIQSPPAERWAAPARSAPAWPSAPAAR
jgi:autotransporter-associated beta strand protein